MAWGTEEIAPVRRVDLEEDAYGIDMLTNNRERC